MVSKVSDKDKNYSKTKGNLGEEIALLYLIQNGHKIIKTQFHSLFGEIDIIAEDQLNNQLVFVEVKNYKKNSLVHPLEAITRKKQQKLVKTAKSYLVKFTPQGQDMRFDLIVVENNKVATHLKNIIS